MKIKNLFLFFFGLSLFLLSPIGINAQTCGTSSYTYDRYECDLSYDPVKMKDIASCDNLGSTTYNASCSWNFGSCQWSAYLNNNCSLTYDSEGDPTGCLVGSGSPTGGFCTVSASPSPSPPSGPVCGNGLCESGEDSSSCSADCPIVGSCSGGTNPECYTGSNCGEIGKVSGSGSCTGGALCCVNGVGGSAGRCDIGFEGLSSLTLNQGQTVSLPINLRVYNSRTDWNGCRLDWPVGDFVHPIQSANSAIATITPGEFCSIPNNWQHDLTRYASVTGNSVGTTVVSVRGFAQGDFGSGECFNSIWVNVLNTPAPSCNPQIIPSTDPTSIVVGEPYNFVAIPGCDANTTSHTISWTINGVTSGVNSEFVDSSGNPVAPPVTSNSVYVLGNLAGDEDQIQLTVEATGPGGTATFTDTVNYVMGAPGPWWQVFSGDILTGPTAAVSSLIPNSCSIAEDSGACRDELIIEDVDSSGTELGPGIILASSTNFGSSEGNANRADGISDDWVANTHYAGTTYDYAYFNTLISGKSNLHEPSSSVSIRDAIASATADVNSYKYIRASGNRSTVNIINVNANSKVIVLVEGNLTIDNRISVNETNNGFLMIVAGGDISVDPSVRNVGINPAMEGVYFTDGIFSTGTDGTSDDDPFTLRGMVAALGGFSLQRDLGDDNVDQPAEMFEYAPEYSLNFPTSMSEKQLFTREVIP